MEMVFAQWQNWIAKLPRELLSIMLSILLHGTFFSLLLLAMIHFHEKPNDPIITFEVVFGDLQNPLTDEKAVASSYDSSMKHTPSNHIVPMNGKQTDKTSVDPTLSSHINNTVVMHDASLRQKKSEGYMRQSLSMSKSLSSTQVPQNEIQSTVVLHHSSGMPAALSLDSPELETLTTEITPNTKTISLGLENASEHTLTSNNISYEELLAMWFEDHRPKQIFVESNSDVEGHAMLQVTIASDGSIISFQLEKSTGNKSLDAAILETAKLANPVPPFPSYYAHEKLLRFRLPIAF